MKKLFVSLFLGATLIFSGCQGPFDFTIHDNIDAVVKEDPAKAARYSLDELNAITTAVAKSLKSNQSVLAKEDYNIYKAKLLEAGMYLDKADVLLDNGEVEEADHYTALAKVAVTLVKKELVKAAGR